MPSDFAEKVPLSSSDSLSWPPAARIRSPLAGVLDDRAIDPLPVHADVLDAEIVLGPDLEAQELGVEHDLLAGQIFAGERRGLVFAAGDRERERFFARQAELVLPAELDLPRALDLGRLAGDGRRRRASSDWPSTWRCCRSRLAVAVKVAMTARAPARRPRRARLSARLRAGRGIRAASPTRRPRSARAAGSARCARAATESPILIVQPARIDLRRQLEFVAAVTKRGDDRVLRAELGNALRGPPDGACSSSCERDRERLAVGDDQSCRAAARAS